MCTIDTWAEFKKQPYLEDVAIKQGRHMKKLNHTSPIWDYMKEFSTLMLEIPNMTNVKEISILILIL